MRSGPGRSATGRNETETAGGSARERGSVRSPRGEEERVNVHRRNLGVERRGA